MSIAQTRNPYCPIITERHRKNLAGRGLIEEDDIVGRQRKCARCNDFWPMDTEFFMSIRYKLDNTCRACQLSLRESLKKKADKSAQAPKCKACAELRE